MNQKDLTLHSNKAVDALMPATTRISDLLKPIKADITQSSQLSMVGIVPICDAIGSGHSIKAICEELGVSVKAFNHWKGNQSDEDQTAIDDAKIIWLESLETICQSKLISIAKIGEDLDEEDQNSRARLELRNRAMQNVERIIKSVQVTLMRLQTQKALTVNTDNAEVYVTNMVVSKEWLSALPDELDLSEI